MTIPSPTHPIDAQSADVPTPSELLVPRTDGGMKRLTLSGRPLPALHAGLTGALAAQARVPGATPATVVFTYTTATRFLGYLAQLDEPPTSLADLTPEHMRGYLLYRPQGGGLDAARKALYSTVRLMRRVDPALLSADLRAYLTAPRQQRSAFNAELLPTMPAPQGPLDTTYTDPAGRSAHLSFARMPLSGLHPDFAAALAVVRGSVRRRAGDEPTAMSAAAAAFHHEATGRFLAYLAGLDESPDRLRDITPGQLRGFWLHKQETAKVGTANTDLGMVLRVLRCTNQELLCAEMRAFLAFTAKQRAEFLAGPSEPGPLDVVFTDSEGQTTLFPFGHQPLPALHADFSTAFDARCRESAVTSAKSASSFHTSVGRFLRYLSELAEPPTNVTEITPEHMRDYLLFRKETTTQLSAMEALATASRLLRYIQPLERLSPQLRAYLALTKFQLADFHGETWPGKPADPSSRHAFRRHQEDPDNPLIVPFRAANGYKRVFDFTDVAQPGMRQDLAQAFRALFEEAEQAVALAKARGVFDALTDFSRYLAGNAQPAATVFDLLPEHVEEYGAAVEHTNSRGTAVLRTTTVRGALRHVAAYPDLRPELRAYLERLPSTADTVTPPSPEVSVPPAPAPSRPGRGQASAMPVGPYDTVTESSATTRHLVVAFRGEDGRGRDFDFATLPFPAFHADLASAFAARSSATGTLRTVNSAVGAFNAVRAFLSFLETLAQPPGSVSELTVRHMERFRMDRLQAVQARTVASTVSSVHGLLSEVTPTDMLSKDVRDYITSPYLVARARRSQVPGYSDREFQSIMAAARSDVVAIRDRIRRAERLLAAFRTQPASLSAEDRLLAEHLDGMDRTGRVPVVRAGLRNTVQQGHLEMARHLFLTSSDLMPLLLLGVGLSGRNAETLKELPSQHRVLENQAVAVTLTKRRRGKSSSREGVHWEVGRNESRQLHTPGGFYLLLHQLTARGRRHSGGDRIWSVWAGAGRNAPQVKAAANGHVDPFANRLGFSRSTTAWAHQHGLTDDQGKPLVLTMNRLKTTVEVRTTKAMGGHLPSASRTNTMDVSFAHYLKGDPIVREWADEILATAINSAQEHATSTRRPRVLTAVQIENLPESPEAELGTSRATLDLALAGDLDTLASSCLDIDDSPYSTGRCDVSFLTCLRCPNALITHQHLPRLLSLRDALDQARNTMDLDRWVREHGRTWLSLTRLILPQFTPADLEEAAKSKPAPLDLTLLEGPKEPA